MQAKMRSEILAEIGKLHSQIEFAWARMDKEHPIHALAPEPQLAEPHLIEMLGLIAKAILLDAEVKVRS